MYKIIEELYYTKEYDMLISYKYYKKFAIEFNKLSVNEYIYNLNKLNNFYQRDNNTHILYNVGSLESSITILLSPFGNT